MGFIFCDEDPPLMRRTHVSDPGPKDLFVFWESEDSIVLPAKSDSGVMFCLQSYQDLELIDHLYINPIRRIGLIHK